MSDPRDVFSRIPDEEVEMRDKNPISDRVDCRGIRGSTDGMAALFSASPSLLVDRDLYSASGGTRSDVSVGMGAVVVA